MLALADAGATVRPVVHPRVDLARAAEVHHALGQAVISGSMPDDAFAELLDAASGDGEHGRFVRSVTARVRDWHRLDEKRQRLRATWAAFFAEHDVLLTPVTPTAALSHQDDLASEDRVLLVDGARLPLGSQWAWIALVSPTLLPATVAPVGRTVAGLPIGVQIVGPYLRDRTTIAVAGNRERLLGGSARRRGHMVGRPRRTRRHHPRHRQNGWPAGSR